MVAASIGLVGGAIVAQGYHVTQTPRQDDTVWALQQQGSRYGQIDTRLGEIVSVNSVRNPSDLVQTGSRALLFSQGDAKVASVDAEQPADLTSADAGFDSTPGGTARIVSNGRWVGYLTGDGQAYVGDVSDGARTTPVRIDAPKGSYSADAIAIGADGVLYSYSHAVGAVTRYDIARARVLGTDALPGGPAGDQLQLTVVGDSWALFSPDTAQLWIRGHDGAIATGLDGGARLQQASTEHASVVLADDAGAYAFELSTGRRTVLAGGESAKASGSSPTPAATAGPSSPPDPAATDGGGADDAASGGFGIPAAPIWSGSTLLAAWLGDAQGSLYHGTEDRRGTIAGPAPQQLDGFGARTKTDDAPVPVFRGNGTATILNDESTGWVWLAPSGRLVESSQQWGALNPQDRTTSRNQGEAQPTTDPKPPVAVDDRFGVRAGAIVTLPVLLNDYDPNDTDVLTIRPETLTQPPPGFGSVSITNDGQALTVSMQPGAGGTATFRYQVTDGTEPGGLNSGLATVTLTVHPADVNAAPQWCKPAVEGCALPTPQLEVAPGGTATLAALTGWVDPDGDPLFVASASTPDPQQDGVVSVTPDGHLVYRNPASNTAAGQVRITLVISDVRGATAQEQLDVAVTQKPALAIQPFGAQTDVGEHVTVDPSAHVSGADGPATITGVSLPSGAKATATVDQSGTSFDFAADAEGSYPVTMTMADDDSTATAIVRITVFPAGNRLLATAPVTVFVRPQSDTSVDVFSAVSNPSGAVLLLSGTGAAPKQAPGATLYADVVGQSQLRVRGSRADGQPGLLGTVDYLVSDGSADADMTVRGRATVYVLPASQPAKPIAVADTVTVRAGAQIDIPVLDNDVVPDGNQLSLDPSAVQIAPGDGLAFASGRVLRYLAPSRAGTISIRYSIYTTGYPTTERDTTTVKVVVLPAGGNRPPHPQTLTGRVLSGRTVSIPFDGYGIDPDGDTVSLDRIISQPAHGTAAISATGDAIEYTSTAPYAGADQFSYQVRDSQGDRGVALVRVGVLSGASNPAPIAFSDYVQVQAGSGNQVVVHPTDNDIDPAGSRLSLDQVLPDAPPGSNEASLLKGYLDTSRLAQGEIVVHAPPDATATSLTYTYQISNPHGDTSQGLIVVRVVDQPVPDYPVIADTVVPAQDRAQLAAGVDVVAGKVSWTSGDIGGLTLSLWGAPKGVSIDGDRIVARVGDGGLLVPFKLSGTSFSGRAVASYGFLRVPPLSAVILALKPGTPPVQVKEAGRASFSMGQLVAVPSGTLLQVDDGHVAASGARAKARCTASGDRVTYAAGRGEPWTDSCTVPVRISGQSEWTLLAVPVVVTALEPEPVLGAGSVEVSPGAAAKSYQLTRITQWSDHALSALSYRLVTPSARVTQQFEIALDGSTLSVRARDDATPGAQASLSFTLPDHPGVAAGTINLTVGPAPSTLPAGATVAQRCSESSGSDCTVEVIGRSGEFNPYHTPLVLAGITSTSGCPGVTFRVDGTNSIRASWGETTPGGSCQARFSVRDAQGRLSGSTRDGTLLLDLQGYPQAPASVEQTGYGDGSVTLTVDPGGAAAAYPALQGFTVSSGGKTVGSCDASGRCAPITGLDDGDEQIFEVRSRNAVGLSADSAVTAGWAYAPPGMGSLSTSSTFDSRTTQSTGVFSLTIANTDSTTTGYDIVLNGKDIGTLPKSAGATTTKSYPQPVGPVDIAVTPLSAFPRPPVDGASAQAVHASALAVGLPSISWKTTPTLGVTDGSITVGSGVRFNANQSPQDGQTLYVATGLGSAACTADGKGGMTPASGAVASGSSEIDGLQQGSKYDVWVCYSNGFGLAQKQVASAVTVWKQPDAPQGYTFTITQQTPLLGSDLPNYVYRRTNAGTPAPSGFDVVYGGPRDPSGVYGADPGITVQFCLHSDPTLCSNPSAVVPASGSAPWQLHVTGVALQCTAAAGAAPVVSLPVTGGDGGGGDGGVGASSPTVLVTSYSYWQPTTIPDPSSPDGSIMIPGPDQRTDVDSSSSPLTAAQLSAALPAGTDAVQVRGWLIRWGATGFADYDKTDGSSAFAKTACD